MARQYLVEQAMAQLWDDIEQFVLDKLKRTRREITRLEQAIVNVGEAEGLQDDIEALRAEAEAFEAYIARNFHLPSSF